MADNIRVLTPNEFGRHPGGSVTYGRSPVVDPWGTVLATAPDGPGLAIADCDLGQLERIRRELPSLANRCPVSYRWEREALALA